VANPAAADLFGGGSTRAGPAVTETEALTLPAFFRAVDNLCSHLAMLPISTNVRTGPDSKERDPSHPVHGILNREANPEMTAYSFKRTHQLHTVLWGNGLAEIERSRNGQAMWVWPVSPGTVELRRVAGELRYSVSRDDGSIATFRAADMIHQSHIGMDGITGFGIIQHLARENVGQSLALAQYVQSFFGNDMHIGLMLSTAQTMKPEDRQSRINSLRQQHQGADSAFRTLFMDGGIEPKRMTQDNEAAQMVESWTLSIDDAARWINVPPPLLFELSRATFSNITELVRGYERLGLGPWMVGGQQEFTRKLFTPEEKVDHFVEYVPDALVRADIEKRYAAHKIALDAGFKNIDEVRALENDNPLPDGKGKEHRVPMNTMPVGQEDDNDDDEPSGAFGGGPDDPDDFRTAIAAAHQIAFDDAARRMEAIEAKALTRAEKANNVDAWREKFYPDHAIRVRDALIPPVEALAGVVRATLPDTILDAEWDQFVGEFTKLQTERYIAGCRAGFAQSDHLAKWFVDQALERFR
jgi:HK97 family phage portal protein